MGKLTEIPATFEDGQGTDTGTCQSNSIIGFKKTLEGACIWKQNVFR